MIRRGCTYYFLCSVWMITQRTIQNFTKWYKKKLIADMKLWKRIKNAAKIYIFALSHKNESLIWIIKINHPVWYDYPYAICTHALSSSTCNKMFYIFSWKQIQLIVAENINIWVVGWLYRTLKINFRFISSFYEFEIEGCLKFS